VRLTLAPPARAGENPQEIEPKGSISWETLRYAQSDMLQGISSKLGTP